MTPPAPRLRRQLQRGWFRLCRPTCARTHPESSSRTRAASAPASMSNVARWWRRQWKCSSSMPNLPLTSLTARSTIQGPTLSPLPFATSVGPGNCCTDADSISVNSRGIGIGALLPFVFNSSGPACAHCCFGNTTPLTKSTSSVRSATASPTRSLANAPKARARETAQPRAGWKLYDSSRLALLRISGSPGSGYRGASPPSSAGGASCICRVSGRHGRSLPCIQPSGSPYLLTGIEVQRQRQ
jgi:hypothetical protein